MTFVDIALSISFPIFASQLIKINLQTVSVSLNNIIGIR